MRLQGCGLVRVQLQKDWQASRRRITTARGKRVRVFISRVLVQADG